MSIFSNLLQSISGAKHHQRIELDSEQLLSGETVAVLFTGVPLSVTLGATHANAITLYIYPEQTLDTNKNSSTFSFIVFDPNYYFSHISGFLRLKDGDSIILGRTDPEQTFYFDYNKTVSFRHLKLNHDGDAIIFRDLHSEFGTVIAPLSIPTDKTRLVDRRLTKLQRIRNLFGGPIQPLTYYDAIALLRQVNSIMEDEIHRPRNNLNRPGGVIALPKDLTPIIIGDLHGQVDNLLTLLAENSFLEDLDNGLACLIILGDAVHSEIEGKMTDMEESMLIMDIIFKLKITYPQNVHFIRGNHDCFSPYIAKAGIPQGLLWEEHLLDRRGPTYKHAMDQFYELLPYVVISQDFVACHAAPPKSKVTLDLLINIHIHSELIDEITFSRLQRQGYPSGYNRSDVRRFRKSLELPENIPFIVGHNPLDSEHTIWLNAGEIPAHHILYSARLNYTGVFTRIGNHMVPMRYRNEPVLAAINSLTAIN